MREHKYKARDKKRKKWLGVNLHMAPIDGSLWWQFGYGCDPLSAEERDNIKLVEYTSLKDKNGKEIYEGDIVRDCYYSDDEEDWHYLGPSGKGVVIWNDDHAGFQIETNRWDKEKISKALPERTFHQIVSEWYCKRCDAEGINQVVYTHELFYSDAPLRNFWEALRGR